MKLNKRIAAGALAFALVTPVVANAAQGTYITTVLPNSVVEKVTYDGRTFTKIEFQRVLDETNKIYPKYLEAKADRDALEKALETAKERYNKAWEAYRAQFVTLFDIKKEDGTDFTEKELSAKLKSRYETNFEIAVSHLNDMLDDSTQVKPEDVKAYLDNGYGPVTEGSKIDGTNRIKKDAEDRQPGEFEQALDRLHKAYDELKDVDSKVKTLQEIYREYTAASYEKDRLQEEYDAANKKYKDLRNDYLALVGQLEGFGRAFNIVVEATDKGITIIEKTPEVKEGLTAEKLAALQVSIDKANETLRAVEILKSVMPNTSKANMAKLDALVADQKAAIAKAEALIKANKKVAFISTAYAAEATNEDVDALIEELDNNTAAIQEEMKKLDGEVKEEEKPAEKEEEKPAEKEEDKKDDDKKEEKVVEKVVVKEKAANKSAGSNAKTGIAGVAGVAGVLAAASVAYAASKKNN